MANIHGEHTSRRKHFFVYGSLTKVPMTNCKVYDKCSFNDKSFKNNEFLSTKSISLKEKIHRVTFHLIIQ